MIYFKRKAAYPHKRTEETRKAWDKLWKEYESHLKSLRRSLSKNAWLLANLSFHDATVKALEIPSKREVVITLYGGWVPEFREHYGMIPKAYLKGNTHKLSFTGVKKAWVPYTIVGDVWLYEEMHLSDIAAFDYQVMLWKDEIRIQAKDVRIECFNISQAPKKR